MKGWDSRLEIGNMLFGYSRGRYRVSGSMPKVGRLANLLYLLGFDEYGHNCLADRADKPFDMRENDRGGATLRDNHGRIVLLTRPYWWGDTETMEDQTQAELPNLEIRPAGDEPMTVSWYKYMFRDSYANVPQNVLIDGSERTLAEYAALARLHWLDRIRRTPWVNVDGEDRIIVSLKCMPAHIRLSVRVEREDGCYSVRSFMKNVAGGFQEGWNPSGPTLAPGAIMDIVRSATTPPVIDSAEDENFMPMTDLDRDAFDRLTMLNRRIDWVG